MNGRCPRRGGRPTSSPAQSYNCSPIARCVARLPARYLGPLRRVRTRTPRPAQSRGHRLPGGSRSFVWRRRTDQPHQLAVGLSLHCSGPGNRVGGPTRVTSAGIAWGERPAGGDALLRSPAGELRGQPDPGTGIGFRPLVLLAVSRRPLRSALEPIRRPVLDHPLPLVGPVLGLVVQPHQPIHRIRWDVRAA